MYRWIKMGLMRPEDFETSNRGEVSSAPPGIPNPQTRSEQVNDIIARYDQALLEAHQQNQNNVTMVKELSDSNEQLRNDITGLKDQVRKLIANTEKERTEHERVLRDIQHNVEVRTKEMEAEHTKALQDTNVRLRANLQQSHEHEKKRLVKEYEKEARDRKKEFKKHIELMEVKEAGYQTKLEEMAR